MAQSAHNRYALGVDIGGSHVCSAVVDLATGQLCGEPHTDKVDAAAGARTIAGAWAANIRRTAAASGIEGVILTATSCDPPNRRAIPVSMGSLFLVPAQWRRGSVAPLSLSGSFAGYSSPPRSISQSSP